MSDLDALDIVRLQEQVKSLQEKDRRRDEEYAALKKDVEGLKLWRQWTIGVSFVFVLIWTTFLPDIKDAIKGP